MTTMADRFLREVKRMHQLRADINGMTSAEADELIRGLGDDAAEDWVFAARDAQLPPRSVMVLVVPRWSRRRQITLDVRGSAYRGARWDKAHSLHRPNHDRL